MSGAVQDFAGATRDELTDGNTTRANAWQRSIVPDISEIASSYLPITTIAGPAETAVAATSTSTRPGLPRGAPAFSLRRPLLTPPRPHRTLSRTGPAGSLGLLAGNAKERP